MSEKLVLPRFDLPGDGTHRAVRALWITGTLVVLATLVLGLAMWRHQEIEVANAEQAAAKLAAARRAALAPAPALAAQPVAPAAVAAPARGSVTGGAAGSKVLSAVVPTDDSSDSEAAAPAPRVRRHSSKLRTSARMSSAHLPSNHTPSARTASARTASARTASEGKASRKSSSNDDVIDRLLRQ